MNVQIGKIDVKPSEVDYDESRIEVLNKHLQKLMDDKRIMGSAYCIARHGKIIANNSIGSADFRDSSVIMKPDTIFETASITKIFTATAIGKLVEDGVLRWDYPVSLFLPQFSEVPFNEINIAHLLTHTSGISPDGGCFPNKYNVDSWERIFRAAKHAQKHNEECDWIAAVLSAGLRTEPGKEWAYCSIGYALLGEIIKKATGVFAEDYIIDNICKPLLMNDTYFKLPADKADRFCVHFESDVNYINWLTGKAEMDKDDVLWESLKIANAGGGIVSTVSDLIRFGNMLVNNGYGADGARIIGRKAIEKMTTQCLDHVPDHAWGAKNNAREYGLGFDMRTGLISTYTVGSFMHEGYGACSIDMDKKEGLVAAWYTPFADDGWYSEALYSVQNIIWSGLK